MYISIVESEYFIIFKFTFSPCNCCYRGFFIKKSLRIKIMFCNLAKNLKEYTMKRIELIMNLEIIQEYIEMYENLINQKVEDTTYFKCFGDEPRNFNNDKEIQIKARKYWIRLFNRTLNELKY